MADTPVSAGLGSLVITGNAPTISVPSNRLRAGRYPVAPMFMDNIAEWARRTTDIVNFVIQGKINAQATVLLTASAATTVVSDVRCGAGSTVLFMPTTANAAAEIGAGTMYVSSRGNGTFTITHANNAQTDRSFGYVILG